MKSGRSSETVEGDVAGNTKMKSGRSSETVEGDVAGNTTNQDTQRFQSKGGSCIRALICLLVVFVVTTIVLSGVLIWRETMHNKVDTYILNSTNTSTATSSTDGSTTTCSTSKVPITPETLRKAYPGYFRTLEEQVEFEQPVSPIPTWENTTTDGPFCDSYCGIIPERRKRDAADKSFHGCCESSTLFVSPTSLENLESQVRELVTSDAANQFFKTARCRQSVDCTGCTCMLDRSIETAVVYKIGQNSSSASYISDTEIDKFYFNKCCKCMNVGVRWRI